jgi:hypothetical protein
LDHVTVILNGDRTDQIKVKNGKITFPSDYVGSVTVYYKYEPEPTEKKQNDYKTRFPGRNSSWMRSARYR